MSRCNHFFHRIYRTQHIRNMNHTDYFPTGLAKALDYVNGYGLEQIAAHEHELTTYALQRLKEIPRMRIFGEAAERGAVISFDVKEREFI